MTFPIRKSARKLTGIVKITITEVFPEMKPLGNVIIFPVILVTDNTRFYSRSTTQDSIVDAQYKICILSTDNTRFYSRHRHHKILYSHRQQDSIIARQHKIRYLSQTTQRYVQVRQQRTEQA